MGTGNCLALDRPVNVNMALAALRRWMTWGGIDGFRFDLATAIGRRASGFDPHAPLFQAIAEDPVVSKAKLIAEPWDIGPGGYQLGAFPPGWGEWNDRFRDTARRFWRGDARTHGDLATRLAGSRDVFATAPTPAKSVNFIVAHDGFTLADLVSYSQKRNEANGENNRDGTNDNYSWNEGVEGPSEDPEVKAARARDMRNLIALLFAARGTPMLAMGSETGHSQNGNNNAYAQDNATSWIDWDKADASLVAFVGRIAALRRSHPALWSAAWLTGQPFDEQGVPDVEWRDAEGPMRSGAQWDLPAGDMLMAVFAAPSPAGLKREVAYFDPNDGAPAERAGPPEGGRSITGKGWTVAERPIPADIDRVAMIFNRGAAVRTMLPEPRHGSDLAHLRRHQRRFAGRRLSADLRSPRCRRPIDIDPRRGAGGRAKAPAPARPTCTKSTRSPGRPESPRIGLTSRASGRSSRPPPSSRCWRRCGCRRARRRRPASCSRASPREPRGAFLIR